MTPRSGLSIAEVEEGRWVFLVVRDVQKRLGMGRKEALEATLTTINQFRWKDQTRVEAGRKLIALALKGM